jgi:hypothetical protein
MAESYIKRCCERFFLLKFYFLDADSSPSKDIFLSKIKKK